MMDGRCATCKWWVPFPNPHWRAYEGNHMFGQEHRWRACDMARGEDDSFTENPKHKSSRAYVPEDHAGLSTRDDFGCVQWEAKGE
jgi:hypothetical protein